MYPDTDYAEGRGSFLRPVPLPDVNPDASPTLTVSINCSWLPYVRGALQQLLLQATWNTTDPAALLLAQERAENLIDMFRECNSPPVISCPFDWTAPGSTPDGYIITPELSYTPSGMGSFTSGGSWKSTLMINNSSNLHIRGLELDKFLSAAISINAFVLNGEIIPGVSDRGLGGPGAIQALHSGSVVATAALTPYPGSARNFSLVYNGATVIVDQFHIDLRSGENGTMDPGGDVFLFDWGYNKVGGGC